MKRLTIIAAAMAAATGLGSCSQPNVLEGTVAEVTTNTVTVSCDDSIVTFGTFDAEKDCPGGLHIGSPITVSYKGEIHDGFATACRLSAPANYNFLAGSWLQTYPVSDVEQGFRLLTDGSAESINMATLVYTGWSVDGDKLTLSGKSIGNGQTIDFTETWTIEKVNELVLNICQGKMRMSYKRESAQ